jgi:hypothetical protein
MEDNYNSFYDFFKKKLSENPGADDSWTKPDAQRKEEILKQIHTIKSQHNGWAKTVVLVLFYLLLPASLIYNVYQFKKTNQLTEKLQETQNETEKLQSVSNQSVKDIHKVLLSTEEEIRRLNENNHIIQNELEIKNQKIYFLENQLAKFIRDQKESESKAHIITSLNIATDEPSALEKINEIPANTGQTEIVDGITFFDIKEKKNSSFILSRPVFTYTAAQLQADRKQFELGYTFSRMAVELPVSRGFNSQRLVSETIESNHVYTNSHGIHFGYSPVKNLWIRTGLRTATLEINRNSTLALAYDKTNERIQPGGIVTNELILNTRTSFTEIRSSIDISFNNNLLLSQGDLLEVRLKDYIKLDYLQIPLGLEYHQGLDKLKFIIQSGIQWNQIQFGDYRFFTSLKAKDRPIPVNRGIVLSKEIPSENYFSMYAGLGLDYNFLKQFHIRSGFKYNYNFINTQTPGISNAGKTAMDYELGMFYRF